MIGGLLGLSAFINAFDEGFDIGRPLLGIALFLAGLAILAVTAVVAAYFLRGQGPKTTEVEKALSARRDAANDAAREVAKMRRRGWSIFGVNVAAPDVAGAAQVNAVANPETARALQNLLLYTHAISDAEYQAAKDRLLGVHPATADSWPYATNLGWRGRMLVTG